MTPTSVGMRCPECARDRTKVRTARSIRARRPVGGSVLGRYSMTRILLVINVLVFVVEVATGTSLGGVSTFQTAGTVYQHGALAGPFLSGYGIHQDYRLLTSAFIHDGLLHIAFNMWFLWVLGPMLEQAVGRWKFLAIYLASLFAGSFGALLFEPRSPTVGASGALFGLLGALIVIAHRRGISIWQTGLAATLIVNIVFSLTIAGISIGAHIGGVVGGAVCGALYIELVERRRRTPFFYLGCVVVAAVAVVAAIAVSTATGLTPNGLTI